MGDRCDQCKSGFYRNITFLITANSACAGMLFYENFQNNKLYLLLFNITTNTSR